MSQFPQTKGKAVEVVLEISTERLQQCTMKQIVNVPIPQTVGEIGEGVQRCTTSKLSLSAFLRLLAILSVCFVIFFYFGLFWRYFP